MPPFATSSSTVSSRRQLCDLERPHSALTSKCTLLLSFMATQHTQRIGLLPLHLSLRSLPRGPRRIPRGTLQSIYSQESQARVIGTHSQLKREAPQLAVRFVA